MKYPLALLCAAALTSTAAFAEEDSRSGGKETSTFDKLDKDADGQLSQEELSGTALSDNFDRLDGNSDGYVSKREFQRNTSSRPKSSY